MSALPTFDGPTKEDLYVFHITFDNHCFAYTETRTACPWISQPPFLEPEFLSSYRRVREESRFPQRCCLCERLD